MGDDSTPVARPSLGRTVRRGVAWTALSRVGVQFLQLGTSIALARLLAPEAFGVAAVVAAITGFASVLIDLGLSSAIVQRDEIDERVLATAFWLNAILGATVAAIACLCAPLIAAFFDMPDLTVLVFVASASFLLNLGTVQQGLLRRSLDFRRLGLGAVIATVVSAVVSVAGALLGLGSLALVLGPVAATIATTVLLWVFIPWRPHHGMDRNSVRELWSFSRGVLGFGVVNYWARNADNLLVGKFLGATALGFYGRAYNLMMLPITQLSQVLTGVMFPALSRVKKDKVRFARAWVLSTKASWVVGTPLAVGVAACAPALVETLFGARWLPMAPVLSLLALSVPAQMIGSNTGPLFQAIGRTGLQFKLGLATSLLSIVAIVCGLPFGIVGVAAALLVKSWVTLWITLLPALRLAGVGVLRFIRTLALTGFGAVAMGGLVLLVPRLAPALIAPITLVLQALVGAAVFGAVVLFGERRLLRELRGGSTVVA